MLTLSNLDERLKEIGKDHIYSWNLKILVAKKVLVQKGYFGHLNEIQRVREIYGGGSQEVTIYIQEKVGWFKTKDTAIDASLEQYNKVLNETFPLKDADLFHFNKIQEKYKKYL
jgi:hypothetical protein